MEGGDIIAGGYNQPFIAKKKGRGKGPRTKRQVKELREQKEREMQEERMSMRIRTKGTHI